MVRARAAAIFVLAIASVIGACGDSDDEDNAPAAATTTVATSTSAPGPQDVEYRYKGVVFTGKTYSGLALAPEAGPPGTEVAITATSSMECDEASLVAPSSASASGGVVATTKTNFGTVTGAGSKATLVVPASATPGRYLVVADCAAAGSATFGQEFFVVEN